MRTLRCKCGDKIMYTSTGVHDCQGCEICGTTFAGHPDNHKPLIPHDFSIKKFNQNTGKPYYVCSRCHEVDKESFKLANEKE
jgi:hypothetical protein